MLHGLLPWLLLAWPLAGLGAGLVAWQLLSLAYYIQHERRIPAHLTARAYVAAALLGGFLVLGLFLLPFALVFPARPFRPTLVS